MTSWRGRRHDTRDVIEITVPRETTAAFAMAQRLASFDDVLHIPATREALLVCLDGVDNLGERTALLRTKGVSLSLCRGSMMDDTCSSSSRPASPKPPGWRGRPPCRGRGARSRTRWCPLLCAALLQNASS